MSDTPNISVASSTPSAGVSSAPLPRTAAPQMASTGSATNMGTNPAGTPIQKKPANKNRLKMFIGALVLLIVAVGGAAGYYLSLQNQDNRQQAAGNKCDGWAESGSTHCNTDQGIQYFCNNGAWEPRGACGSGGSGGSGSGGGGSTPVCSSSAPTSVACFGVTPGNRCNGFAGTCVNNGSQNGQILCGCVPDAPLGVGNSCTANSNCQSNKCVNNVCVECSSNTECGAGRVCSAGRCTTGQATPQPSPSTGTGGTGQVCTPGSVTDVSTCTCGTCGCGANQVSKRVCNQAGTGYTAQCVEVSTCTGTPTSTCSGKSLGDACTAPGSQSGFCNRTTSGGSLFCAPKVANGGSCNVNSGSSTIPLNSACQSGRCLNGVCRPVLPSLEFCSQTCAYEGGCTCPAGCTKIGEVGFNQNCGGTVDGKLTTLSFCSATCTDGDGCTCPASCVNAGTIAVGASCGGIAPSPTPTSSGSGGTGGNTSGASGTILATTQADQARGACPFVVTCNCGGSIGTKQHCAYGNIYSAENVIPHCQNEVCPAVGSTLADGSTKVCEPGWQSCLNDGSTKAKVCNMRGTGFYPDAVNAHACGATHTTIVSYCLYNNAGTKLGCMDSLDKCNNARSSAGTGAQCRIETSQGSVAIVPDQNSPAGTRYFKGCGTDPAHTDKPNLANCYNVSNGNGTFREVCSYEPGLSCGARITEDTSETPIITPPGETPPPVVTPPPTTYSCNSICTSDAQCQGANPNMTCVDTAAGKRCRLTSNPTSDVCAPAVGPMCLNISMNVNGTARVNGGADPVMGDAVQFTCGTVSGAARYVFRVIEPDGQVVNLQATGATSANYTINKAGTFRAQCQICTSQEASSCLPFEQ